MKTWLVVLMLLLAPTVHALGPEEATRATEEGAQLAKKVCGDSVKIAHYHSILQMAERGALQKRGYGLTPSKEWDVWETAHHKLKGFEFYTTRGCK
jgi:hypothetical protein